MAADDHSQDKKWVTENVVAGRVSEAEFTVDLAPNEFADAVANGRMANEAVNVKFNLTDVTTRYFKDLPLIHDGSGQGLVQGDRFDLALDKAQVDLPSGDTISLSGGTMAASDLLATATKIEYRVRAAGRAATVLDYIDLPALNLLARTKFEKGRLDGNAAIRSFPQRPCPQGWQRGDIDSRCFGESHRNDLKNAFNDVGIDKGTIAINVAGDSFTASGPARIAGVPVQLSVTRDFTSSSEDLAVIEAQLTDDQRAKIAGSLNEVIQGPIGVKVTLPQLSGSIGKFAVDVDLSQAELILNSIGWSRDPTAGTSASFVYETSDKGGSVRDLKIKGPDLSVAGDITLSRKGGIAEATLPDVTLSDENQFSLDIKRGDDGLAISIAGRSFDARPLIKSIFGGKGAGGDDSADNVLYHRC